MSDERDRWSAFLSTPVDAIAAGVMRESWLGRRFGSYEIVAPLGAGGMGEVYRARDTRLGRDVAVKVLPASFTADRERVARFEREARVLAALNHPHIAAIYGVEEVDGAQVLVLELVEGETLAARIARGPIAWRDALPIATQICGALEAAHERGIVHRDLKPSNIALTKSGAVKVLDFGLAKATEASAVDASQSPTLTVTGAHDGVLLGTAAYMSPEQARGGAVDRRTDIWAFGCVLYEMLTGRLAFNGNTVSDHIAAILEREPDWRALPATTPQSGHRVLHRCLEKDAGRRFRDIADARLDLEDPGRTEAAWTSKTRVAVAALLACVAVALLATAAWMSIGRRSTTPPPQRFSIDLGAEGSLATDFGDAVALSPDGTVLAFVMQNASGSGSQLFMRRIDQLEATAVRDTDGASSPFFSPDGKDVAFFADHKLKRVPLAGGSSITLCDAPNGRGGWWGGDRIVFSPDIYLPRGMMQVSSGGGEPTPLVRTGLDRSGQAMRWPQILPGGDAVLFSAHPGPPNGWNQADVVVVRADGSQTVVVRNGYHARYSSGHLLYARDGTLFAIRFDLRRLQTIGDPVRIVEGVEANSMNSASVQFAVSDSGTLLYVRGRNADQDAPMHWIARDGGVSLMRGQPANWQDPQFSPDGSRIAMHIGSGNDTNIYMYEWAHDALTRLVTNAGTSMKPVWSSDGRYLAFRARPSEGQFNIFVQRVDGAGQAQQLTHGDRSQTATSWHPSGRFLAFQQLNVDTKRDIMILPLSLEGSRWTTGEPRVFVRSPGNDEEGMFSPDGRWVAYYSDETGRDEVYVRPFEGAGGPWQVSQAGGSFPTWSRSTPELLYETFDGGSAKIMAAPYTVDGESFHVGKPTVWSPTVHRPRGADRGYDIHPDGRRGVFAVNDTGAARDRVVVVLNAFTAMQ